MSTECGNEARDASGALMYMTSRPYECNMYNSTQLHTAHVFLRIHKRERSDCDGSAQTQSKLSLGTDRPLEDVCENVSSQRLTAKLIARTQ